DEEPERSADQPAVRRQPGGWVQQQPYRIAAIGPARLVQEQIEDMRAEHASHATADRHASNLRPVEAELFGVARSCGPTEERAEHRKDSERCDRTDLGQGDIRQHGSPNRRSMLPNSIKRSPNSA